jgi:hypothetical protein
MHLGRTETDNLLNYKHKHNRKKDVRRSEGVHLEVLEVSVVKPHLAVTSKKVDVTKC